MFNQLTLTCAFVDEAIPCKHATRFQYLNEVIHRPKEPFLTDADVTSGVSYYGNALLAEGARNRAFEDQNLMAQLGAASLLESLSFVQSQPSQQLDQLAYSFQQPQQINNQNNNEQQGQQEFSGSFQSTDTQFANLQSSSPTDNIDQQQQQQINAYAIDTTGNNIEQNLNFSRIQPQTQVEFSNEQAPNSLQYQYQDQSHQYQDQTINQQNILDTQVPLEVNREQQQQQQQVNLQQPQESFIYNNQNQQQAQVNNQQQNQQATGNDQLINDRSTGLTPVAVSNLSGSLETNERENISAFTRASVSPDLGKPAASQLFDFSFVTSHADLVARQPTNQFVAGNDQQIVQAYTGYPSISQSSENSNQVQQQQEQVKVEENGGNLRALNLTRVNVGSPINQLTEGDNKIDTTTTNLPNQSSQTSYSISSLSTELTTESPSSAEPSNTTITATIATTPASLTTPISTQATTGHFLINTTNQKTTDERINNSKRRSALRNLHRSTSFQSNRVSANQENQEREHQQSPQKPSSLPDKKQSASIVMRQMIAGIEESRNKQQQVPRLSSRGKKRQTQISDQFVQSVTFGGDNIDIQAPKFESMVTKRRT